MTVYAPLQLIGQVSLKSPRLIMIISLIQLQLGMVSISDRANIYDNQQWWQSKSAISFTIGNFIIAHINRVGG